MRKSLIPFLILVTTFSFVKAQTLSKEEKQVEDILRKLSIEQKVGQLNLIPIDGEPTEEHLRLIKEGKVGSVLKSNGVAQNLKLQKLAVKKSKGGIPILFQEDVIHGYKTIAPVPLAEAASWDLEAIQQSAAVAAREASASGVHLTYAPMVDISRDPRWGRVIEAAGEDPYLGSRVAAARVKGFQATGEEEYQNILGCVKHFVGYGASLAGRDYNIQDISERQLREVHLPPFQAAVDAGVASLMCAYTAYDGVPLTANSFLMKEVLRDEMKFKGTVITDWETVKNLVKTGIAENEKDATEMSIKSGIDIDMTAQKFIEFLPELVEEGRISEELVDNAVRNVLKLKQRAGLLDDPYAYFNKDREKTELFSEYNQQKTKDIAIKSMVLLKNEGNILPIKKGIKNIAIIGPFAKAQRDLLGWWACKGNPSQVISIYEGIEKEFGSNVNITYAKGCDIDKFKEVGANLIPEAVEIAKSADVVIMVLGEEFWMSGEGGGTASLHLPSLQEKLIEEVAKTGKPIISVIATGRPYVLTDVAKNSTAVLQAWMPGTMGGEAVAEILSGKENPSGKLPITFPYHEGQVPIFYSYKRTSHSFDAGENNNRYSTTHRDVQVDPLYPFGYGLSYTTFNYSDITLSAAEMKEEGTIKVSIDVTNSGTVKGREVVQLYIQDVVCSVTRPSKELKDFKSIDLKPGEIKTVTFEITKDKLTFIGRDYKKTIEAGEFKLYIGKSSDDLEEAQFFLK